MNAGTHAPRPERDGSKALHCSPEAYREFIAETLDMARIHAELAVTYASISDDTGLAYALRRMVSYFKAALGALDDLQASKAREQRQ